MNKIISLAVLAAILMFVAGCGQQAQEQQQAPDKQAQASQGTPVTTQPDQPSSTMKMGMLYNYGKINEYEYRITSNAGGQQSVMNIKYKISSDTANGKAAWLQQSDMNVQGTVATTKIWMDKATLACLKISTFMDVSGQKIQQEGQCPTEGPNSASATAESPVINYIGKESVTVPAGTFSAKKYESGGVSYWIADDVPLPLKVSYSGEGAMVMEMVSYK